MLHHKSLIALRKIPAAIAKGPGCRPRSRQSRAITIGTPGPRDADRPGGAPIGLPPPGERGWPLSASSSSHPFADMIPPEGFSTDAGVDSPLTASTSRLAESMSDSADPESTGLAVAPVSLPTPSGVTTRRTRHPFDTHAFVSSLERANVDSESAKALMEAARGLITRRADRATGNMLSKEELDNEVYLFKAALSKLGTEFNVRTRNAGIAARDDLSAIRRELDAVEIKMAEEMQILKHDIEIEVNDRKTETRSEIKSFDIAIEEINNRATISVGDLKTEIESAKWEATRRAITIIVVLVICGVGISSLTIPDTAAVEPPKPAPPPPATRDIGIGPEEDPFDYEARIEKLLKAVPPPPRKERKERRPKREEIFVDRI
ncbi:putative protein [Vanrija pseudolonga]|uniref:Purtative protein n=1 Tax=Vanrija pseudolonga TaxID=143232 RepID=A0AAF1BLY6_9TREE|nr:purtative protein [Vanrija pseudolonga]